MGLTRWLWKAGIDPKWFRRAAAARDGVRGKNLKAGTTHCRQLPAEGPGTGLTPKGACAAETPAARRQPVKYPGNGGASLEDDAPAVTRRLTASRAKKRGNGWDRARCVAEPDPGGDSRLAPDARKAHMRLPVDLASTEGRKRGDLQSARPVRSFRPSLYVIAGGLHHATSGPLRSDQSNIDFDG